MAKSVKKAPWIPRPDILKGEIDDAVFGVDFEAVVEGAGKGPVVYSDAKEFEKNTYPTEGLRTLVREVFGRLSNPSEAGAAIRLSTGFGGGKTHSLIALFHLARNITKRTYATDLLPAALRPGKVSVAAIDVGKAGIPDFVDHDGVTTHTIWGEIAYRLHNNRLPKDVASVDDLHKHPNSKQVESIFPSGPALMLLDEPVKYLAALGEQEKNGFLKFIDTLVSAIRQRPQTVLVITDPGPQPAYAQDTAKLAKVLAAANAQAEILGRKDAIIDPIGEETANVIRKRLFDWVDEKKAPQLVSAEYLDAFRRISKQHPGTLPAEATTEKFAEEIVKSYPFHPRLMTTLRDRLGAIERFQRSRGVLRILARVLRELNDREELPKLISAGDIDWQSAGIQAELLDRLGLAPYKAAVSADIADHAGKLDGGADNGVHRRVASALLLESLPDQSTGLSPEELTLAVLRPDEAGPEPGDALQALTDVAWHTHQTPGGRWRFQFQFNVNRVIEDRLGKVAPEDAAVRVQAEAQRFYSGHVFKAAFWPQSPRDVRDDALLQLVVCDSEERAKRVLAYSDDSDEHSPLPRANRNGIFAVCPTTEQYDEAVQRSRRLIAAERVEEELAKSQDKQAQEQLKRVKPDLAKQARNQVRRAMNVLVLTEGRVFHLPEEMLVSEEGSALQSASGQAGLLKFLLDKRFIYKEDDGLDPAFFLKSVLPGTTPVVGLQEVYSTLAVKERIYSTPRLLLVPGDRFVKNSLLRGVEKGSLVLRTADGSCFDKDGCVAGPDGARRRSATFVDLGRIVLDKAYQVTPAGSAAAAEWLKVDERQKGGPGKPPRPKPPEEGNTATDWPTAIALARKKALKLLALKVVAPADYAALVTLLPPLGATDVTVSTSVQANLKGGGSASVGFTSLKLQNPIKAHEVAEKIARAADGEPSYESEFALDFGEGRAGMADALKSLSERAPEGTTVRAEFV